MKAGDIMLPVLTPELMLPMKGINVDMPLLEVLPQLLDAPGRILEVKSDEGESLGYIDEKALLAGLGRLIAPRDDSSVITVECEPDQYSASEIAHAVEDADAHLVDLISRPAEGNKIRVMLRIRALDAGGAIRSLERYGYQTVEAGRASRAADAVLDERLASLRSLLNV